MFLFLRLLLAHFIADFPLQTTSVYVIKVRDKHGLWVHTSIIFLMSLLFVYPYWGYPWMWVYLVGSTLVHHASDAIKIYLNRTGSPRHFLLRYVGDQIVHVSTASAVLLLPIGHLRLEDANPGLWAKIYNSDFLMLYGSLLIVATYFSTYFIEALKKSYWPKRFHELLPTSYKTYGIFERACLFHLAFLGGLFWATMPFAILPRYLLANFFPKIFNNKIRCISALEMIPSFFLGILPGIALRLLTRS